MKRRVPMFLKRASTWWIIAVCIHFCWCSGLTLWLSNPALEEPLIDWVDRNRSPTQGGPSYIIAYGYIINTLVVICAAGILAFVLAGVLSWREWRHDERIKGGLCAKCDYDLRGSTGATACPECGVAR